MLMFEGFSNITLDDTNYDLVLLFNEVCSLSEYVELTDDNLDQEYLESSFEVKQYFNVLVALNKLESGGLVERKIFFSSLVSPENGIINLNGKLKGTDAESYIWLSRGLSHSGRRTFENPGYLIPQKSYHQDSYTLENLEYQLTTKGFDVALKYQEHSDAEIKFNQQKELTKKAVEASKSSASTARIALWAAFFIALGSIGNLVLSLGKNFEWF